MHTESIRTDDELDESFVAPFPDLSGAFGGTDAFILSAKRRMEEVVGNRIPENIRHRLLHHGRANFT